MASTKDYAEYVMDCISSVNLDLRIHRMFGEYCIYANDKPIMFIMDDTVCVKCHPSVEELMRGSRVIDILEDDEKFKGKSWFMWVLDIERGDIEEIIYALERLLPMPKPKKRKRKNEQM